MVSQSLKRVCIKAYLILCIGGEFENRAMRQYASEEDLVRAAMVDPAPVRDAIGDVVPVIARAGERQGRARAGRGVDRRRAGNGRGRGGRGRGRRGRGRAVAVDDGEIARNDHDLEAPINDGIV